MINITESKRIIIGCYEQLNVNKLDNSDETDKHSEILKKLTKERIDSLNNSVSLKEIEFILKNLPQKKAPGPDGFIGKKYTKNLRKK